VLLGAFKGAWPAYVAGQGYPMALAVIAVSGVVLGALYMLWLAERMLYGPAKAPHQPFADLNGRERAILVSLVAAIFWLGLFPAEPMGKTELASRQYQQLLAGTAKPAPVALRSAP
jgi:NADH-quinone oxidoreductase subunit M